MQKQREKGKNLYEKYEMRREEKRRQFTEEKLVERTEKKIQKNILSD